jgi:hypothetical protein
VKETEGEAKMNEKATPRLNRKVNSSLKKIGKKETFYFEDPFE